MNLTVKIRNGHCGTPLASRFSSLITAHSALFTSSYPLFPRNPLFPASGPAIGSLNGLNPKSKFLAFVQPGSRTRGEANVADDALLTGRNVSVNRVVFQTRGKGAVQLQEVDKRGEITVHADGGPVEIR